jgi:hypothetical protein
MKERPLEKFKGFGMPGAESEFDAPHQLDEVSMQ